MQHHHSDRSSRLRRLAARARTLAVVYLAILFLGTHVPLPDSTTPTYSDKLVHFAGYALLTLCVLTGWELTIGRLQAKHYFAVWLVGTLYAAFDEITQIPVGRTADMNDWACDVLGIIVGLIVFQVVRVGIHLVTPPADARP